MPPNHSKPDPNIVLYSQELAAYTRQQLAAALQEAKEKGAPQGPKFTTKPTTPEGGVVQSRRD
jgi:hypothetical protein